MVGGNLWESGIDIDDAGYKDEDGIVDRIRGKSGQPVVDECVRGVLSGGKGGTPSGEGVLTGHEKRVARWQPRVATDRGCIPRGTLIHRHWFCPVVWRRVIARVLNEEGDEVGKRVLMKMRWVREKAQKAWLDHWEHGSEINHMLWERALDKAAVDGAPKPSREATFWWKTRGVSGGVVEGDIYSDASGLDGG